jgi:hypothetical protein
MMALAGGLSACNAIFGVGELEYRDGAGAGGTGAATSSASAGGAGATTAVTTSGGGPTGSGGGGQGGSGGGGGAVACADVAPLEYEIRRVNDLDIVINGNCDDELWSKANALNFTGSNSSDNTIVCRLLWRQDTAQVIGCCDATDTMVEALATGHDGTQWQDDSIEVVLSNDVDLDDSGVRPKLIINTLATTRDEWVNGIGNTDAAYEATGNHGARVTGTQNDANDTDVGWGIEWVWTLPFSPALDERALCALMMNDSDAGAHSARRAFSNDPQINDPTTWASCRFACDLAEP